MASAAGTARAQALSLLAAANNHGDLAVKLSSLRQVKEILLSLEPSLSAEIFPYLTELHSSREILVRKSLLEIIEEVGLRMLDHSYVLVTVLLVLTRDEDPIVAKKAISVGAAFYCSILEEMAMQFHHRGKVDRWVGELWTWMVKFKDVVFSTALEPGSVGMKVLALKFMETFILLFTPDASDPENFSNEGTRQMFNISWLAGGHPILNSATLMSEANRTFGILLDLIQSAGRLPGALTIAVVSCLAVVARKRPIHYNTVLSVLLDFHPNLETVTGCHAASVQYSIRTALLGFLRCTSSPMIESRDKLLRALRAMNASDVADQAIRQVDKLIRNNERFARENRSGKNNQTINQPNSWDLSKKRKMSQGEDDTINGEAARKRLRHNTNMHLTPQVQISDSPHGPVSINGISPANQPSDSEFTPVEQMVSMIGALLAEGDRGAASLDILISKLHPDMLADIVITSMKHLPSSAPKLTTSLATPADIVDSMRSPTPQLQLPFHPTLPPGLSFSDVPSLNSAVADPRGDPRRDPRRMDPRRLNSSLGEGKEPVPVQMDISSLPSNPLSVPAVTAGASSSVHPTTVEHSQNKVMGSSVIRLIDQPDCRENLLTAPSECVYPSKGKSSLDVPLSPCKDDEGIRETKCRDDLVSIPDFDQHSPLETGPDFDLQPPVTSDITADEESYRELASVPSYVELTTEQSKTVGKLALQRIIESNRHVCGFDCNKIRMSLIARLIAKIDAGSDVATILREHISVDHREFKGHELVLHVLYLLHSMANLDTDESSSYATVYENFLIAVARSFLDALPASDKSFSRLFGEAPHLPDSAIKLLDELCSTRHDPTGREISDSERVTQGLGAVWSLILVRPNERKACLAIALNCSVHSEEDIRAKAIRLVTNKLYHLTYISEHVEKFATDMLLTAGNSEADLRQTAFTAEEIKTEAKSQKTSTSGSPSSRTSDTHSKQDLQTSRDVSVLSFSEAQRLISLFFALCKKKPSLLRLVFEIYGKAPKTVIQAFHRHIPILIRELGSSYKELLHIISDPPKGSENLLTLVLQILTQELAPSSDLIATVKHLYETKLKDVSILIPLLASLTKDEVLPIFPPLLNLPPEKFQLALAHILQGSAHTGPALTPAEVLIAIHDVVPEKDGPPLKKITDACSACFEQRTVFTQQVLAKALGQMVDRTPLPLLFMRTVIQAIDAFPTLVDVVMEILSKLVNRQIWRLPKLWPGFLKCVSQTQPHSFPVLLELPMPQLESIMKKFPDLKPSLTAYANQPTIRASLSNSALSVLGLENGQDSRSQMRPSDAASSIHGAALM
ncbi:hypothetical protein Bca52824_044412 [Brassica carinata]|uniref:Symplekin n=1 Tax=Brassica carinata TaxID=52824 RepID=A0A8X7RYC2_BRACI|nr:hypothetical protein Bca52824_044412 [Brassica carinata]